jgi:phage gp46-like protein
MFDLATRLQPDTASIAALAGVPFDLRLTPPAPPSAYPYTSLVNDTGAPQPGVQILATYALALEGSLATAVIDSLFTDARAGADDTLPLGQTDRRGWVGDEFMRAADSGAGATGADPWGSLLWLLYYSKAGDDIPERARFAAQEALAWLVRDGIASRVDVAAQWVPGNGGLNGPRARLAIRPTIWQPGQVRPVYDVLWGTSIERWASA